MTLREAEKVAAICTLDSEELHHFSFALGVAFPTFQWDYIEGANYDWDDSGEFRGPRIYVH